MLSVPPDDVPEVVQGGGGEAAEGSHHAVLPEEAPRLALRAAAGEPRARLSAWEAARSDHLAAVVDCAGVALSSIEAAEVVEDAGAGRSGVRVASVHDTAFLSHVTAFPT